MKTEFFDKKSDFLPKKIPNKRTLNFGLDLKNIIKYIFKVTKFYLYNVKNENNLEKFLFNFRIIQIN